MKFQKPRGTIDLIGENFYEYKKVQDKILNVVENYGFVQVRTPMFESLELLEKDAGSEVNSQIYKFTDKGGRKLGIKSDITPAIARIVANDGPSMKKPIKFSCLDRVYRYERPQKGRLREITQINAEMFGKDSIEEDVEILRCFLDCYLALGFDNIKIKIGNRPWLAGYLKSIGVPDGNVSEVLRAIDKVDKLNLEDYEASLENLDLSKKQIDFIDNLKELKGSWNEVAEKIKAIKKYSSNEYISRLEKIFKSFEDQGIEKYFVVDLGISRGSDYYTGIIFEASLPDKGIGSIGGGGRYDNLVRDFGNYDIPAVGFSIGIDRVVILRKDNKQ
ncbi:histidine--tRNA ligase [Candidatus Dojkabacteria bacterium]|nr:histidine--tRNA ligase [Candidatus Dojkabacteria bacterium]